MTTVVANAGLDTANRFLTNAERCFITTGGTVACAYKDFPDHFGLFLPLAGISTVRQISENAFDIRATSRLNRSMSHSSRTIPLGTRLIVATT